jgi:2-polyprenyl-3-methyl-5-hydroxy-6-metoxy-1,4-benzoquinol methylase
MNVQDMVDNWNAWGTQDPMFAILTDPDKDHGRWKEEEFFATGAEQVGRRLNWLRTSGIEVQRGRALDFGCGIGRLTNALASHFGEVYGVDISASMVERARQVCRFPNQIKYFQNSAPDLRSFKDGNYDFIYSELVLQHIPPRYQLLYIGEFLRLLSPQGVALFQTLHAVGWRALIPDVVVEGYRRWKYKGKAYFPMYAIDPETVKHVVSEKACPLIAHETFPPRVAANRFLCDVYVAGGKGFVRSNSQTTRAPTR